jgi:3-oxoacyl-[acyl-carrier-protein] synthase II
MTDIVITGLSASSALGVGRDELQAGLAAAVPLKSRPLRPCASIPVERHESPHAYEVPDFDASKYLGDKGLRTLDRLTKLLIVTAKHALEDAGLKKDGEFLSVPAEAIGFIGSNAYGSLEAIDEIHRVATLEDARYISPQRFPNTVSNTASGYVSIWEGLRALNVTVSTGNPGAIDAVLAAELCLSSQRAQALLVGGAESLSEALYVGWSKLGLSRAVPLSEAAGLLVFETMTSAHARGATSLARLRGVHSAVSLGPSGSWLHPGKDALVRSITQALAQAGLQAQDVDLVVAGLGGIAPFDAAEVGAITQVLGETVRVAAPKRLFGETLGAAASLSLASAVEWMQKPMSMPLVRGEVSACTPNVVLITELGYYGNAGAAVLSRS